MLNEELLKNYTVPMYVYDINILKDRIKYLRSFFEGKASLCYAIKANTFIVKEIEDVIDRFEVCSPGEYKICEEKQIASDKVLISGVYKTPEFIYELVKNNKDVGYYTIESMEQYKLLKECSKEHKLNIMIRLTSGNQFGITEEELKEIVSKRYETTNFNISGIQYFSGTQKTSLKKLKKEIDYLDEFLKLLKEEYDFEPDELEYGPGFPVKYFQHEEFDEDEFLNEFAHILEEMEYKGKKVLEMGRSIVASCGVYITKVVDKKTNKNQNYAILDGGIHHLVYYGQSMAMKLPKCHICPERKNENAELWNLFGSLCTINDIIVKQMPISNLQIGDIFIFENTGAYCATEGISLFLSRNLPKVILIKENGLIEEIRSDIPTYKLNM